MMTKKATDLQLYPEHLIINGRTISPAEIKMILIRGYFKPVIGILPHGNRIVPVRLTFRFTKDHDQGVSDLKQWAERNHVKIGYKWFQNWI
jgi:hypothetical protein